MRFSVFSNYWAIWSISIGCGVTLVSTAVYFSGVAQPLRQIKIAEVVDGTDKSVLVDGNPAKAGTTIAIRQQVLTLQTARVGLQQADQILARLGAASSATLERDCIQLGDGQLVVTGTAGCIGATIARSQDGVFVLERLGTLGEIKVLSGEVSLTIPSNPALGTIVLGANQKVTLSLTGDEIGPVRLMLPAEVSSIVAGELFQGFQFAIANQKTLIGLLPPGSPSLTPVTKPSPTPGKPLSASKPPADKVPLPSPQPQPVQASHQPAPRYPSSGNLAATHPEPDYDRSYARSSSSAASTYNRSVRRRRYVEPSESHTYRRNWARSPYSGSYSRRRSPSYSAPSYSAPAHPAPDYDLPSVPEAPAPETPTPIELPPAAPPVSAPLPPPVLVEPPMEVPSVP
ncbi:MAG: hypothetical protein NW224_18305 [Leptolyngbyaceae cyanobacterium bins.302]|nr:hypothetical protein [Leptolyngbyaceae cyanobacterium bins.302]